MLHKAGEQLHGKLRNPSQISPSFKLKKQGPGYSRGIST